MTAELSNFAARVRGSIASSIPVAAGVRRLNSISGLKNEPPHLGCYEDFDALALELFSLQFAHNGPYRRLCEARGASPKTVEHWTRIPAVPTTAFKELDLTCLPVTERTRVFLSSGTTEHPPSRHFHSAESLAIYEASAWPWFVANLPPDLKSEASNPRLAVLTPTPAQVPHSSLVHMYEVVRCELEAPGTAFVGQTSAKDGWALDLEKGLGHLRRSCETGQPLVLLGTAFSFVQLLDSLVERNLQFQLPTGSCAMETGGYKGRSRSLPKAELHAFTSERLGVPRSHILCEYGMTELSSQAYDTAAGTKPTLDPSPEGNGRHPSCATHHFQFPPWARVQVVSPETGRAVADRETGLICVFDLANVFSVMAIQTEDLGIRRGDGFELIGRAALAEPRAAR